ncbi:ABC transporter ATP-binding protein [Agrobacterium salinitolerans]|uniref:ABC transporter ATP-binding protein n=1 Tax=Agrobacterium salinitolerans TaxID=1183413 RepID=UPI00098FB396|nr:ABC transporter ATP-binding protein [Agrobacterium salinitolerans]OOO27699.1 ABC transporter ATP-binding protein [Agrobacterium salinitolerans]PNQ25599.1 ABC transporter ATP-binding protein [Rhizobium sp. YIC5082]
MTKQLLSVQDLSIDFLTRRGRVQALEDVSFNVSEGEILGIVGESGSGKSVLSYSIMGLSDKAANIRSGSINFRGAPLKPEKMADLRGREISMVFQSPRTALNPIRKVGHQIEDVLRRHTTLRRKALRSAAIEALTRVRIPDPARRYEAYPFEMSGGMCQRVMIAMALACKPALLICDEPTTGLDVTTQAVIMDLIRDLVAETKMAAILITHDLALAGEYCDQIAVMHAGHIVEVAQSRSFPDELRHPYTERLFAALPSAAANLSELAVIPGSLPDLRGTLPPCRYIARCERAKEDCSLGPLPWAQIDSDHLVRCRYPK